MTEFEDCLLNYSLLFQDVRYFPKGIFPSGNLQSVFSQVPTSHFCPLATALDPPGPKPILAAALSTFGRIHIFQVFM